MDENVYLEFLMERIDTLNEHLDETEDVHDRDALLFRIEELTSEFADLTGTEYLPDYEEAEYGESENNNQ